MKTNVYLITQKGMDYSLTINENSISCEEFKRICDKIVNEYGNDLFIVHEKLKNIYGFKDADVQCSYQIPD